MSLSLAADPLATSPVLGPVRREAGLAGQYALAVPVTYPGEATATVRFYGSSYGGPIVMVSGIGQVIVDDPDRFGWQLDRRWVERFFA